MYTKNLKELSYNDVAEAGGKGASLGEMLQAGFPIPNGFVVLASTFEKFLEQAGIEAEIKSVLKSVNIEAMHTIEEASEKIQYLILNAHIPEDIGKEIISYFNELDTPFVAVRSSATAEDSADAAWAGQLETYLNTTKENVLDNIRKCWASLFSPRAIFYRFEKKLHDERVSVAVVVQKMVQSDTAGIAFSVHPVTQDHDQILIEAGFGLGEAIVSGAVTPDSFVINKKDLSIQSRSVHSQNKKLVRTSEKGVDWVDIPESEANNQKITDEQLLLLSKEIEKIESHYKFPVDIEWAIENDVIYITQSRPITTLDSSSTVKSSIVNEILSDEWNKDWENKYSLFLTSASCKTYFTPMQEVVGFCFSKILITHKEGITSCYHLIEDYENFGNHLSNIIANDQSIVEKWVSDLKKCADSIRDFLSKADIKTFSGEDLTKICNLLDIFGAHHIPNKTVINFLSEYLFKKHAPLLEEGRKYIEIVYHDIDSFGERLIEEIQSRNQTYSAEGLRSLLLEEAYDFFDKGILPDKEILTSRFTDSGLLLTESNKPVVISKEEVDKIKNYWIAELNTDIIKGKGTFPGKIKGVCKVITNYRKDASLEEGEILVTGMTDPNFVPLMKKAAAIVTDAGGLLSHAAIVSRELKIPCVVGTKVATSLLKTGDVVEVDADVGVVEVVEKVGSKSLTKVFSRERPLIYFNMWNDSDRMGYKDFLDLDVEQNFFVKEGDVKTSVYYPVKFLELFDKVLKEKAKLALPKVLQRMNYEWTYLLPYLKEEQKISSYSELLEYYQHLITWWSGMTTMFTVPDLFKEDDGLSELLEFRKESEKYSDQMCSVMTDFLKTKSPLEFDLITIDEVKELNDGKELDLSVVKKRRKGYVMDNGVVKVNSSFDEIVGQKGYYVASLDSDNLCVSEVEGNTVFPGNVSGKVRIIKVSSDLKNIQEGDILVTEMTSPNYVPYLKKVSAIVTDEGGLTCHASIISRELRIPCIVGTKNATSVLKDGDLVEVDADLGVIRVLKRNKENEAEFETITKVFSEPFTQTSVCEGTLEYWKNLTGLNFNYYYRALSYTYQYKKESRERTQAALITNPKLFEHFFKLMEEEHQAYVKWARSLPEDFSKKTELELKETYYQFRKIYKRVLSIIYLPFDMEVVLTNKILGLLPKDEDKASLLQVLSSPLDITESFKEQIDFLKIVVESKDKQLNENQINEKLKEHQKEFSWLNILALRGKPFTLDHYLDQFQKELLQDPEKELEKLNSMHAKQEVEVKDTLDKINASEELKRLVNLLRKLVFVRTWRLEQISKGNSYVQPLLKEICKRKNVAYQDFIFLKPEEADLLVEEGKFNLKDVKERQDTWSLVFDKDIMEFYQGNESEKITTQHLGNQSHSDSITGQPAFKGEYTGRVKVLLTKEDLAKIEEGDVLVTAMTTPDFLSVMKKSGAIITDIGGVTCHAAIVARELQKPCIIGTKNATSNLKDGDLVEVDAVKGIVRKI